MWESDVKNKKLILAVVELIVFLTYAIYAVTTYSEQEIFFTESDMQVMERDRNFSPGTYLDTTYESAIAVVSPAVSLDKGIYYITASYRGNGIIKAGLIYDQIRRSVELVEGNEFDLNPQEDAVSYRVKIRDDSPVRFKIRLTGDAGEGDYVQLLDVRIASSKMTYLYSIMGWGILLALFDFLLFGYFRYYRTLSSKQKMICIVLAVTAFLTGLPLYQPGLITGYDLTFHLQRIEGVYKGLLSGQFPVRIQPGWLHGNGYAASVFYGDILLYFPAVLRMVGFTVQESCKIYAAVINIATVLVSFYSFRKMTKDDLAAMIGTVLYAGNIFRLLSVHTSVVGTYSAMMFYPLIFAGFYLIFTENVKDAAYKRLWVLLTVGFSGMLMTHMISCLMVGVVSLFVCLTMIKKVFRKETFFELGKAVLASVLLNLWYLVPFLQYMGSEKLHINSLLAERVTSSDYYALMASYTQGAENFYGLFVKNDTVGYVPLMVMLIYVITIPIQKKESFIMACRMVFLYTVLIMWVCTDYFPSVELARHSKLILKYFQSIQSSGRFLGVIAVMVAGLGALFAASNTLKKELTYLMTGLLCCIVLYQSLQYFVTLTPDAVYLDSIDLPSRAGGDFYSYGIGNAEYLPVVTDTDKLTDEIQTDEGLEIINSEREYLSYDIAVINKTDRQHNMVIPLIYYSGYESYDLQNKVELETAAGDNGTVEVKIPAGYSGTFHMAFHEPWLWRMAEIVSLLTLGFILLYEGRGHGFKINVNKQRQKGE